MMTSECQGTQYFRGYGRELVSKPTLWCKEKLGGLPQKCFLAPLQCRDGRAYAGFTDGGRAPSRESLSDRGDRISEIIVKEQA